MILLERWTSLDYLATTEWFGLQYHSMLLWRQLIKSCGTLCLIMVDLSGDVLFMISTKFRMWLINMFLMTLIWCGAIKVLLSYVATYQSLGKVGPWMGLISWYPLALGWFLPGLLYWSLSQLNIFQFLPKEKKKKKHNPISCKHVSLWWCLLFDHHQTT